MTQKQKDDFDYSKLSPEFSKLGKPAQRALINNGVFTPKDLSKRTQKEVFNFHGLGPSALPILQAALKSHGLTFKNEK